MSNRNSSSVRRMIFAAAALALGAVPAYAASGDDQPAASSGSLVNVVESLDRAERLIGDGQWVEAKSVIVRVQKQAGPSLTAGDSQRAMDLLAIANSKIKSADRYDVSLQKAALALREGNLLLARRQSESVVRGVSASSNQVANAEAYLAAIDAKRAEALLRIPAILDQAKSDCAEKRFAQAKAGLEQVERWDVAISPEQRDTITTLRDKITKIELDQGAPFDAELVLAGLTPTTDVAALGVLQPGVVRRQDEQPAAQPPTQPPAAEPAWQPDSGDVLRQAQQVAAQALLAEADQAYTQGQLPSAIAKYSQLLSDYRSYLNADELARAQTRYEDARLKLRGDTQNLLGADIQMTAILHDKAVAEFDNFIAQSRRSLESGDTATARSRVANAQLVMNSNRAYFSEAEFEQRYGQAEGLLNDIAARERQIQVNEIAEREQQLKDQAEAAKKTREQERERRINELIDRARSYQSEMKYDEALQAVEQLLFIDPINPAGLLLRDLYTDIIVYQRFNDIQRRKHEKYSDLSLDNEEASLPEPGVMNYPADWPKKSYLRGEPINFAESPENRAILGQIDNKRQDFRFENNNLEDVVRFFTTVTQINVDPDWTALEEIGIDRTTPISLNLTNVRLRTALDRILEKASAVGSDKADWAVQDGVLIISSDENIRKNTTMVIYDVRDLLIDIPDFPDVPELDLQSVLQQSQGGGGGQSPFRDNQQQQQGQGFGGAERRTLDERTDELIEIIQENVDPTDGWIDTGGSPGRVQKLAGSLIITNTPKNHSQIAGLLSELRRVRQMQINVETRFLLVNQDYFEQIGFDLDVYLNANNNQFRAARVVDPSIQPSDFFNFGSNGFQSQRGLQRNVSGAGTTAGQTGTPTITNQAVVNPRSWSPLGVGQNSLGLAQAIAPSSDWAGGILDGAPALGIAGQFLDDIQVDFLVQATQADRRSIQLTAPRLTFTNGQTANIYVVTQIAFVSDLQPVVGDSAVGFDPTVDAAAEGVTLLMEGTISADRRYVTLNVDAGVARIDGFGQQPVTAVAGGQLVNSADTQSFIQLPQVTVTRVRTTVSVPDQGTVLLGGQRVITEFEVETGVPVLSKLPVINRLFTNRIESREEQALLILIKPTVLIQNEEEEKNFPGLLDSMRSGFAN